MERRRGRIQRDRLGGHRVPLLLDGGDRRLARRELEAFPPAAWPSDEQRRRLFRPAQNLSGGVLRQEPGAKPDRPCRAKFAPQLKPDLRSDALPVGFAPPELDTQAPAMGTG